MLPVSLSAEWFPPFLGIGDPPPRQDVLFLPLSSSSSVPRQDGAAGSATLLCPAASGLHSEPGSQSSALHNSTAKLTPGQSHSTEPWGRRSLTLESEGGITAYECSSTSPTPEIRILIFNPSQRSDRLFASKQPPAIQRSPKGLNRKIHIKGQGSLGGHKQAPAQLRGCPHKHKLLPSSWEQGWEEDVLPCSVPPLPEPRDAGS